MIDSPTKHDAPPLSRTAYVRWLSGLVLVYILVALTYAWVTPPLESSDEYKHYPVVQHIQTQKELPILDPDEPGLWLQEAAQPPLYYLMMALLTMGIDTSDLNEIHRVNPHAFVGDPNQITNKNLIIHQPALERFPGQGTILAVYTVRLASILLGVVTLLLTARLGRQLISSQVGLFAAALTAFNPMFLFISGAVNNDSLAIMMGHAALLLLVGLWQGSSKPRSEWLRYVALGAVLGLGLLTKLSLGGLVVLTVAALAWKARTSDERRSIVLGIVMILGMTLIISGWWFGRNLAIYGDLTGLDVFTAVQGSRETAITWSGWVEEFGTFFRTYWGLFGGVNIAAPNVLYNILNLAALAGAVGLVKWWRQRRGEARPGIWLLLAWGLILMALLVRWTIVYPSFQGRLIFPALGGLNVLWAIGLTGWVSESLRTRLMVGVSTLMVLTAAFLPWTSIRPAYARPEPLLTVPETARYGPVSFTTEDGVIQLVGVEMEASQSAVPGGGPVKATLYWQLSSPVAGDYVSSLHLLGRQLRSEGQVDRYPASGMIPTSWWQPGQIYRDEYHVFVGEEAIGPARLRLSVSIFDDEGGEAVPATGPDGSIIDLLIVGEVVRLAAGSDRLLEPANALGVTFNEGITLTGYTFGPVIGEQEAQFGLTLYWNASAVPAQDYTVFVHLVDSSLNQLAGADAPPVGNDFPTSLWRVGDRIDDLHLFSGLSDLPSGEYWLRVGLYDPINGSRLMRTDGAGDAAEFPITLED